MNQGNPSTRRQWLAKVLMGTGLALSYGTLAVQGLMFLLPRRLKPRTRNLYAGQKEQYSLGGVRSFYDLQGNQILVKRNAAGFEAFSSTCPHLGCRVHWEKENQRFYCPCHRGVFNAEGVAISGPPADAGQSLIRVPLNVDESGGVVYIEVRDVEGRHT